jgi:hypothetical protein
MTFPTAVKGDLVTVVTEKNSVTQQEIVGHDDMLHSSAISLSH